MPLTPNRRLQIRIAAALALVVGVNALVLSALVWSARRVLSASGRSVAADLEFPLLVGAVLLGAIGLVVVQARYGSWTAISGLETEPIDGDGARNVGARVRRLATQADVTQPSVAVTDCDEPNCLTVGTQRSPTIVVTTGLLEELDDDELEAALAHEIAHLANRDLTVVSAVAAVVAIGDRLLERERLLRGSLVTTVTSIVSMFGTFWLVPYMAVVGLIVLLLFAGPIFVITAVLLVVSPVARLLLALNAITLGLFAKNREYAADRGASQLVGDPAAVASALETIDGSDRPRRDIRLDASATLGIVPQSLSIDRSGDDEDDDEESWFERWIVGQFRMWGKRMPEKKRNWAERDLERQRDEVHSWQRSEEQHSRSRGPTADDDESKSWIIEPFVKPLVDPIRDQIRRVLTWLVDPIRDRIRRVLAWRLPTHPTTDSRIEQLRSLERSRHE